VSMALHSEDREQNLKDAIEELRKCGTVDVIRDLTILSLVGKQMKHMIGIAGRMFTVLAESKVNIEMISQGNFPTIFPFFTPLAIGMANNDMIATGASEINISCVVRETDAIRAMNILHTKLFIYQDSP